MKFNANPYLTVYAAVLTAGFAAIVLTSGGAGLNKQKIDVLDVQRINLREPDGTIRYVLSNNALAPGLIFKNQEYPHPGRQHQGGMIFFNDEGTENGGLSFSGGQGSSVGHLSFDAYENDQTIAIQGGSEQGKSFGRIVIADRPGQSILPLVQEMNKVSTLPEAEQQAFMQKMDEMAANHEFGEQRLTIGKTFLDDKGEQGASVVDMKDKNGKTRLRMTVTDEGDASIEFLDANGNVVRTLTPDQP